MRCDGLVAEVRDWAAGLDEVHRRIAGVFASSEPRPWVPITRIRRVPPVVPGEQARRPRTARRRCPFQSPWPLGDAATAGKCSAGLPADAVTPLALEAVFQSGAGPAS